MYSVESKLKRLFNVAVGLLIGIQVQWAFAGSSLPHWATEYAQDNATYYYGVGEGQSRDHAIKAALTEIGGKLGTELKSSTMISKTLENQQEAISFKENIDASIRNIEYSNFDVVNAEDVAGKVYVLVRLDRVAMATKLKNDIQQADKYLRDDFARFKQYSSLKKSQETPMLQKQVDKLRLNAAIVKSLTPSYDAGAILDELRNIEQSFGRNRDSLEVLVVSDSNTQVFARKLQEMLTRQGLKVVSSGARAGKTVISLEGNKEERMFDELEYWTKLLVNIQVFDEQGKILKTSSLTGSGASMSSYSAALNQANAKVYDQFVVENIMNDLGLN